MNLGPIKDKTGSTMLRKKTIKKAFTVTAVFCVAAIAITYAVSALNKPNQNLVLEKPTNTNVQNANNSINLITNPPSVTDAPDVSDDAQANAGSNVTTTMLLPVKEEESKIKTYAGKSTVYDIRYQNTYYSCNHRTFSVSEKGFPDRCNHKQKIPQKML